MALITWNESLSVGIRTIDEQHKKLVGMINALNDAMGQGNGSTVLKPLFEDLLKYTMTHFAAEEKLMQQYKYPRYSLHKMEHEKLTRQVQELRTRFDAGQQSLSVQTLVFLKNWLTGHIQGTDKLYAACFTEHGLN
jgi:hemerythrin-like metal-binding protein